ncbi:hypothetical protein V6N13_120617 [Hibiscus sabdariffa]
MSSISEEFSSKHSPTKHSIEEASPKRPLPRKYSAFEVAKVIHPRELCMNNEVLPSTMQKVKFHVPVSCLSRCASALVSQIQPLTIVGIGLAWGLVLMASIYAVGHISGAHFNPAVTLAFAAGRKFSWKLVPMYIVSQLLGATLASLTLRALFHAQHNIEATVTQYKEPTTDLEAIAWEFIVTFILMFIICAVATDDRATKGVAGAAIGATVMFNAIVAGPITGASMNPARSIGPAVVSGVYKNLWVYIVAPILGAMAATLVYSILRVPKAEKPEESAKSTYNDLYVNSEV